MMKISELAHHTGTSIRSLRYYEAKHLLCPNRQENGYRSYDITAIERVRNIQFYLRLGLTAHQIFHIVCCSRPTVRCLHLTRQIIPVVQKRLISTKRSLRR